MLAEEVRHAAVANGELHTLALANEYLAWFCVMLSRLEDGLRYARIATALWRDVGNPAHEATAQSTFAWLLSEIGHEDAIVQAQQAVATAEMAGDVAASAFARNAHCVVLWGLQQHDLAQQAGAEAVALARRSGDRVLTGRCLINAALPESDLSEVSRQLNDHEGERRHRERCVEVSREAASICSANGDSWAACIALCNLAETLLSTQAFTEATAALDDAAALAGEVTLSRRVVLLHARGMLMAARGRHDQAIPLLQDALAISLRDVEIGVSVQIAKALSDSLAGCGRYAEALELHRKSFDLHVQRNRERTQVRARALSRQQELDHLRLRAAQFERLSGEDALTGLANRRQLDLHISELSGPSAHYALAMIDVDHFKSVNDSFSHIVGDEVLRVIGMILKLMSRESDTVGRFGGEEFMLIMPQTAGGDGASLCERLRAGVAAFNWQQIDPRLTVTISIGFAESGEAEDAVSTLALADHRLFAAKRGGRNQVVCSLDTSAMTEAAACRRLAATAFGTSDNADHAGGDQVGADQVGADQAGVDRAGVGRAGVGRAGADHAGRKVLASPSYTPAR